MQTTHVLRFDITLLRKNQQRAQIGKLYKDGSVPNSPLSFQRRAPATKSRRGTLAVLQTNKKLT